MPARDSSRKNKRARIIEAIVLGTTFLSLLGVSLFFAFAPKETATYADVVLKGTMVHRLSLKEEQELMVQTDIGDVEISIKDGGIAVLASPCPNKSCIHMGYKHKVGETIICAPASLSIHLLGGEMTEVVV